MLVSREQQGLFLLKHDSKLLKALEVDAAFVLVI
jgi:hypothetical protein